MPTDAPPAAVRGPRLLRALDNPTATDDGLIADCPVWECTELLELTVSAGMWRASCDAGHDTHDLAAYLALQHDDLRVDQDNTRRLWRAIVLSPRVEVCEALLRGQPVPRTALDPSWARRFGL